MKKGFTLIELIATLAILMILFSMGIKGVTNFSDKTKIEENKNFIREVRMLISTGKRIAVNEKINLSINIDGSNRRIILQQGSVIKQKIIIPRDLRFMSSEYNIKIKSRGRIEPFSWKFTDGNKVYKISRPMEGDYINVSI